MDTTNTNPATDLDLLLAYATRRGAHPSVILMIERARQGDQEMLPLADTMWATILRSPARQDLLGQLHARPTGAEAIL